MVQPFADEIIIRKTHPTLKYCGVLRDYIDGLNGRTIVYLMDEVGQLTKIFILRWRSGRNFDVELSTVHRFGNFPLMNGGGRMNGRTGKTDGRMDHPARTIKNI